MYYVLFLGINHVGQSENPAQLLHPPITFCFPQKITFLYSYIYSWFLPNKSEGDDLYFCKKVPLSVNFSVTFQCHKLLAYYCTLILQFIQTKFVMISEGRSVILNLYTVDTVYIQLDRSLKVIMLHAKIVVLSNYVV